MNVLSNNEKHCDSITNRPSGCSCAAIQFGLFVLPTLFVAKNRKHHQFKPKQSPHASAGKANSELMICLSIKAAQN